MFANFNVALAAGRIRRDGEIHEETYGSMWSVGVDRQKRGNMKARMKTAVAIAAFWVALSAGAQATDQQIRDFFASGPTSEQIAKQAASLGMNAGQIMEAMAVAGYGSSPGARQDAINSWVGNVDNGYGWGPGGVLMLRSDPRMGTPGLIQNGQAGQNYYGNLSGINALNTNNYATIYNQIKQGDLTVGQFVGNTVTYANKDIKDFFASNPTPEQIAEKAAELNMTARNVSVAIAIGAGAPDDVSAVRKWIAASKDYAMGPDEIVVKLAPGQRKDAQGMLMGSWSDDPGNVSYTQFARDWYAAGNGGGDCRIVTAGGPMVCPNGGAPRTAALAAAPQSMPKQVAAQLVQSAQALDSAPAAGSAGPCPTGMTMSVTRAGIRRCTGTMARPVAPASLLGAVQSGPAQQAQGAPSDASQTLYIHPSNIHAQEYAPRASSLAETSQGFISSGDVWPSGVDEKAIKEFFATNPTPEQIAKVASELGLTEEQIIKAMEVASYGSSRGQRETSVLAWVGDVSHGYGWGPGGVLMRLSDPRMGIAGVIQNGQAGQGYYGNLAGINALGTVNNAAVYNQIRQGDLTVGQFVGNTRTYSNQEVKSFFAANPSPEQIAAKAAELSMTARNVSVAIAIGAGAPDDVEAVKKWVAASKDYALGPDDIVVKLTAGQTKRADGLLEGAWSSDPGRVSYTQWAREWYEAGNGGGACRVVTAGGPLVCSKF